MFCNLVSISPVTSNGGQVQKKRSLFGKSVTFVYSLTFGPLKVGTLIVG